MGLFILLEGNEGAGKSGAARRTIEWLRKRFDGLAEVKHFREPGSSWIGPSIREMLLQKQEHPLVDEAEFFLFLASRAQVMRECILPALESDAIVVLDRSTLSTMAYQVAGRGLPMHLALPAIELATCGLVPDLTFLLSVNPEVGMARKARRGDIADRIEAEGVAFHYRVAEGYKQFASLLKHRKDRPWRICEIDTNELTEEEVTRRIIQRLERDESVYRFGQACAGNCG